MNLLVPFMFVLVYHLIKLSSNFFKICIEIMDFENLKFQLDTIHGKL